jgi:hypothetical protein
VGHKGKGNGNGKELREKREKSRKGRRRRAFVKTKNEQPVMPENKKTSCL